MIVHQGSCHCGAVEIELRDELQDAAECNCSLCWRYAALWHYCSPDKVTVTGKVEGYVQGDRTLTTWRCATCACIIHWTALDPDYNRMGINLRMFDPALWLSLPRRLVDGASY